MTRNIVAYVATLVLFVAIDFVWLTNTSDLLYKPILGPILAPEPRMKAGIAFYLIYIVGLVYFAVLPALRGGGWGAALIKGALFGFFAYATYDLTNQATLLLWSSKITVADMLWGSFVSGAAAVGGFAITRKIVKA